MTLCRGRAADGSAGLQACPTPRGAALKGCATAVMFLALAPHAQQQAPPRDAPPPTGTSVIRGRVLAAGERPLAKVEVRASAGALRVNKAVLTDANGRYEIAELPAGRYTLMASKPNYVAANYGQRRPLGPGTPIEVAAGQVVAQINFSLQRTSAIAGRIVDEFGDPAIGVQVVSMRQMYINGERRMQMSGPTTMTNDLGEYRLFGLMPGQYFVSATLRSNVFGPDSNERTAYAPTLYPGTGNPIEAQRLAVAPGQTIAGINMTLLPVTASRISGTVLDTRGQPMSGAFVNVMYRLGIAPMGGVSSAQARPDGTFSIGGLPPGDYTLRASVIGNPEEFAAADVTVGGGDLTDVQLIAARPSTVRGRIVFDKSAAKPPAATAVRVSIVHPSLSPTSAMPGNATPKDDGTFEAKTGAGHSLIRAFVLGTGDWRLARVLTADGADVIDAGLEVPANGVVDGLVVEMTSRHNEITGTVVDAAGEKVRDCVVIFFAQDPLRWTISTRYFGVSRPDVENTFHTRLPAGDYLAVAFDDPDPAGQYAAPDVLQQLRDHAIAFTIGQTEKKTLELPLSAPPIY